MEYWHIECSVRLRTLGFNVEDLHSSFNAAIY